MFRRSVSLPSSTLSGKEAIDTTYGQKDYVKQINQYKLLRQLGEGTYSRVFLGQNVETGKYFAIKRINIKKIAKTAIGVAMLRREITMISKLCHPHIVSLHEVIHVKQKQYAFLVLDYCDCGNLWSLVRGGREFAGPELRYIFKQVVSAVAHLHESGIVHQDIKPQNILLKSDGTAMLSDFGVGHSFQSSARVFGTPAFQAPEVIDKNSGETELDPGKEDVWSLGITLYYLAFRKFPYVGSTIFEIFRSIETTTLTAPFSCDPLLWDLIIKMLNPKVRQRYSIKQVMEHEYVKDAENLPMQFVPFEVPSVAHLAIKKVEGIVCDENYVFEVQAKPVVQKFVAPFKL